MVSKISIIICFLFFNISCLSQKVNIDSGDNNLFLNGIYIKNININIPWEINYNEIKKYGNPVVKPLSKKGIAVKWDSIIILNDISLNMFIHANKSVLKQITKQRVSEFVGSFDSLNMQKLKKSFEDYSGTPGKLTRGNNNYYYYWIIDNCNVGLGYRKQGGYFLRIQKRWKRKKGIL